MRIRDEQLRAFARNEREKLTRRLVHFLRTELPSKSTRWSDEELSYLCRRGLAFGEAHGLKTERNLARLVLYFAQLGVDFRQSYPPPWVAETLLDEAIPVKRRLEKILGRVIQEAKPPGDVG